MLITTIAAIEILPDGALQITALFTDDQTSQVEKRQVRLFAATLETVYVALRQARASVVTAEDTKIQLPLDTPIDIDGPAVPPPTQAELDMAAFSMAVKFTQIVQQQVELGVASAQDLADAKTELVKKFKPEYLGTLL